MQKVHASKYLNPVHMLESGKIYQDQISLDRLSDFFARVENSSLEQNQRGFCSFKIYCSVAENGKLCIKGEIESSLVMQCQRCMSDCGINIEHSFTLYPVRSGELKALAKGLDPLILSDKGDFEPEKLICDELLLSVPFAPKHEECDIKT